MKYSKNLLNRKFWLQFRKGLRYQTHETLTNTIESYHVDSKVRFIVII